MARDRTRKVQQGHTDQLAGGNEARGIQELEHAGLC